MSRATQAPRSEVKGHSIEGDDGSLLRVEPDGTCRLAPDGGQRKKVITPRAAAVWFLRQNTPAPLRPWLVLNPQMDR